MVRFCFYCKSNGKKIIKLNCYIEQAPARVRLMLTNHAPKFVNDAPTENLASTCRCLK